MSGKRALVFVGKSIAFALISGLVWGSIAIFIASFSTRDRGSSSSDGRERMTEQMDAYDRQVREAQEQLDRSAQQQERNAKLLDRQERMYAEQEQLQKRFAAILEKWEKIPGK
jgi:predicted nuclease with TOPRIM domain